MARWGLRLSELEFDIIHGAGIIHQAADAISQLETTETDHMPIEDKAPVLCIPASILFPKGEMRAIYMQEYDVLINQEDNGIPQVYGIVTSTDTEYDDCRKPHRSSYWNGR